jgi:hypothetical protein
MSKKRCMSAVFAAFSCMVMAACTATHTSERDRTTSHIEDYLVKLPADLESRDRTPLTYFVSSIFHNRSADGKARSKVKLTAEYTRLVEGTAVSCRWDSVTVAAPSDPTEPFPKGVMLDYMEGFEYTLSGAIMSERLYQNIPDGELKHLLKTLVWDAAMFEPVVWDHFALFKLHRDVLVSNLEQTNLKMGQWGSLRLKGLKMSWVGVSMVNNEVCALLQYRSYANPVLSGTGSSPGRSLYWGSIWVSLEDKQVEKATLNEDVILEMRPAGPSTTLLNLQREVTFLKSP